MDTRRPALVLVSIKTTSQFIYEVQFSWKTESATGTVAVIVDFNTPRPGRGRYREKEPSKSSIESRGKSGALRAMRLFFKPKLT